MVSRAILIAGLDDEIAAAIARRVAARGDLVALMSGEDPTPMRGQEVAGVDFLKCNLANPSSIEAVLARVDAHLGPLDHLIFGTSPPGRQAPLNATTRADWTKVVDTPPAAAFHLCQAAMPRLAPRKHGSVLFLLSESQAALYAFAKSLAREFAPAGIRVNCLGTGWMPAGQSGEIPMGRLARPDEVAAAADFLLSDRAWYITGQLLQPNGGSVMW